MASDVQYCSIMEFIQGKSTAIDRLAAVEICIDNAILLLASVTSSPTANISEYQLDDSMVKLKTTYRSIADIQASISALEKMANIYRNQIRGRQMVCKDIRTFR